MFFFLFCLLWVFSCGGNCSLQINMEVNLHKQQILNLEEFVSHLTHTMHSLMPESFVYPEFSFVLLVTNYAAMTVS